jgi:quinol monooxygenase YgiN
MPENSLRVVARIMAKPDKVEEVRAILSALVEPTRKETGCVSYELLQNRADPTDFTFVEEWRGDPDLEAHFATEHLQSASQQIEGLVTEEPDIRTYTVVD